MVFEIIGDSTAFTLFYSKGGKLQKRGKINLIGRLQLTTEKTKEEDNEGIVALRVLRTQVCVCLSVCLCVPRSHPLT